MLCFFINPRRACAARVTVLGSVGVCVPVKSHLTSRISNRKPAYSVACERQKICGDLPEKTAFKSYAAKHKRKSQCANLPAYSTRGQLFPLNARRSTGGYPTSSKDIQPCPKRCLLMLRVLACVGARTGSG